MPDNKDVAVSLLMDDFVDITLRNKATVRAAVALDDDKHPVGILVRASTLRAVIKAADAEKDFPCSISNDPA